MAQSMVYLPKEGDWVCAACGGELAPSPVNVAYLQGGFTITLLACQGCGMTLVPEYLAVGKMHEVELLLEDK